MRIVFVGGTRYRSPLDPTSKKKFTAIRSLGELFVVGFSTDLLPRRFNEDARFYLFSKLPFSVLRYAEISVFGPPLIVWLILRHNVQILIAQSPYEGVAAALAKKIAGWFGKKIVLVVESHGDFEESLFMQRRVLLSGFYRFLMRYTAKFALKHADVFRTISNSTRRQLDDWIHGPPVVQFPPWTDIETFLQSGKTTSDSTQTILYAGVLTPLKGVHHLVNAFGRIAQEFPSAQLAIIGKNENKPYVVALSKQIETLGLKARVRIMGAIPQSELAFWMANSSVLVLPSLSEGLGRVIIEAMASGTPVIGTHVGGIPDMIEDGVTGFLVPPGDETSLAEKIRWVLEQPAETQTMGKRARIAAEQFFSTETYVEGYRNLFSIARTLLPDDGQHAPSTL